MLKPIETIATNLIRHENGMLVSRSNRELSYPNYGNDLCFQLEDNSFWFNHRNEVIFSLARKFSRNQPFFDIGGGNGCVAHYLQNMGLDTVLIEPGPRGTLNAQKRGIKTIVQSTFEDAGFLPESFNAVGLFDVLEHIEEDLLFMSALNKLITPRGIIYITVPAYDFLWSHEDKAAGHFRRYTISTITKLLSSAGFEIIYSSYFFSILVPAIFALRTIPSMLGIRKSTNVQRTQKEHSGKNFFANEILGNLLKLEKSLIRDLIPIPTGSSCIVAARKR